MSVSCHKPHSPSSHGRVLMVTFLTHFVWLPLLRLVGLWPTDTSWSTSTSSAKVKCFAVYQKLENNRKQQLNTHITLKVFKSPWKNKICQISAKSKGNISEWSHAGFVFILGCQYLAFTFMFKANGFEIQTLASKIFLRGERMGRRFFSPVNLKHPGSKQAYWIRQGGLCSWWLTAVGVILHHSIQAKEALKG